MSRMRRKAELPTKPCAACARPFTWRRKWARDWEAVRFCSDRCRRAGVAGSKGAGEGEGRATPPLPPHIAR